MGSVEETIGGFLCHIIVLSLHMFHQVNLMWSVPHPAVGTWHIMVVLHDFCFMLMEMFSSFPFSSKSFLINSNTSSED
jgi:hypothetical protein